MSTSKNPPSLHLLRMAYSSLSIVGCVAFLCMPSGRLSAQESQNIVEVQSSGGLPALEAKVWAMDSESAETYSQIMRRDVAIRAHGDELHQIKPGRFIWEPSVFPQYLYVENGAEALLRKYPGGSNPSTVQTALSPRVLVKVVAEAGAPQELLGVVLHGRHLVGSSPPISTYGVTGPDGVAILSFNASDNIDYKDWSWQASLLSPSWEARAINLDAASFSGKEVAVIQTPEVQPVRVILRGVSDLEHWGDWEIVALDSPDTDGISLPIDSGCWAYFSGLFGDVSFLFSKSEELPSFFVRKRGAAIMLPVPVDQGEWSNFMIRLNPLEVIASAGQSSTGLHKVAPKSALVFCKVKASWQVTRWRCDSDPWSSDAPRVFGQDCWGGDLMCPEECPDCPNHEEAGFAGGLLTKCDCHGYHSEFDPSKGILDWWRTFLPAGTYGEQIFESRVWWLEVKVTPEDGSKPSTLMLKVDSPFLEEEN